MSYIKSYKGQTWLLPPNIGQLIPKDHVCYLVEDLVASLNYNTFDRRYEGAGHPAYHPSIVLKILVMGVIDKVRSSRKLARNARENVVYMYLAEKLAPDFRTISDFRKENPKLVKEVFKHTITLANEQGLLDLDTLSTDGSKIKANASAKRMLTKEELKFLMNFVDKELEEWAEQDKKEDELFGDSRGSDQLPDSSRKKIKKAVKNYIGKFKDKGSIFKREIKNKLDNADSELEKYQLKKVSITDPECRFMKSKKGNMELSYNPQLTVDKKGFILANDVSTDTGDAEQLQPQVLQTIANIGSQPKRIKWNFDNGYFSGENIAFLEGKKIDGYIPDQELAQKMKGKNPKQTYIGTLNYNRKKDTYAAPNGDIFTFRSEWFDKKKNYMRREYVLRKNNKVIKTISASPYQFERDNIYSKMRTSKAREIYKIRSETVEPAIGDIKENKGFASFLTRSLETVKIEFNLACIAHNLKKIWLMKNKNFVLLNLHAFEL
jgi:transposase